MAIIKRYWVAALVMLLVMTHAMIIGYVRTESAKLKSVASSEIPLGMYYVRSPDRKWLTQLRILLAVPLERRQAAKATIEHNRWLVYQTIEEALLEMEPAAFEEATLDQVKEKVKQVLDESLHEKIVERILICDRFDLPVDLASSRQHVSPERSSHVAIADVESTDPTDAPKLTDSESEEESMEDPANEIDQSQSTAESTTESTAAGS